MKKQIKSKNKKISIDDLAIITKRGFDGLRANIFEDFATKKDFNELKNEVSTIKHEMFSTKDEMLTGFDKVLNKLDKIGQENIVHDYRHRKIDEILELHDARIKKLEIKK